MRRYIFYLSVALLAFGIGSLFAVELYWAKSVNSMKSNVPVVVEEKIFACPILLSEPFAEKFSCEDESVKVIWNKLKKDESFGEDARRIVEIGQIKNCRELFYEPQKVDLNNDNLDEIILMGNRPYFCGSGGDCETWIVSKINNDYKIIFESTVGEFPGDIQVLRETNRQFQDLKIKRNNHWEADTFGLFEFDGSRYRVKRCLKDVNSHYEYDDVHPKKLVLTKLKDCS